MKNRFFTFVLFSLALGSIAQNTTIQKKNDSSREALTAHKVLLIPFEPRLYMSEVDMAIHNESKLSAREIKYKFRDGINDQLYKAFKTSQYNVVDLMEDTLKYKKDTEGLYQYLSYEYLKVPDQNHYQAPKKEKEEKKIDKGQLNVETNGEMRFMDARISNPKAVSMIYAKYKTDLFVFINQLDIKASGSKDPTDLGPESAFRKIVVHYTVYTYEGKEINSGIAEEFFDPTINNPKKIIDKHFSKLALVIVQRVNKAIYPTATK